MNERGGQSEPESRQQIAYKRLEYLVSCFGMEDDAGITAVGPFEYEGTKMGMNSGLVSVERSGEDEGFTVFLDKGFAKMPYLKVSRETVFNLMGQKAYPLDFQILDEVTDFMFCAAQEEQAAHQARYERLCVLADQHGTQLNGAPEQRRVGPLDYDGQEAEGLGKIYLVSTVFSGGDRVFSIGLMSSKSARSKFKINNLSVRNGSGEKASEGDLSSFDDILSFIEDAAHSRVRTPDRL